MRRPHIRDPVPHRLADRILQRLRTRRNPANLGTQQPHAQHVQLLPLHVHVAHVDHALHAQQRAHRRRRHPMLTRAGLGDDALLAHPLRQQSLAQRVVDLVRAGVQQVLALQIDLRPAQLLRQPLRKVQRSRPPREVPQQIIQLRLERRICLRQSRTPAPAPAAPPSASRAHTAPHRSQTAPDATPKEPMEESLMP